MLASRKMQPFTLLARTPAVPQADALHQQTTSSTATIKQMQNCRSTKPSELHPGMFLWLPLLLPRPADFRE
jgi:hypothetical protein